MDRTRPVLALLVGVAVLAAGCGDTSDRLALRTPAMTGASASASEFAILRNWGEQLRLRDAVEASRDFVVPAYVSDGTSGWVELADRDAVERFNRGFTCGARLLTAHRRADGFVVGIFQLVEQPGAYRCGARTGHLRLIAVQIQGNGITRWINEDEPSSGVVA